MSCCVRLLSKTLSDEAQKQPILGRRSSPGRHPSRNLFAKTPALLPLLSTAITHEFYLPPSFNRRPVRPARSPELKCEIDGHMVLEPVD